MKIVLSFMVICLMAFAGSVGFQVGRGYPRLDIDHVMALVRIDEAERWHLIVQKTQDLVLDCLRNGYGAKEEFTSDVTWIGIPYPGMWEGE